MPNAVTQGVECPFLSLAPTFGLELKRCSLRELSRLLPPRSLLPLLQEHLVLVFRGQEDLSIDDQINATALFGDVETPWDSNHHHPDDRRIQIIQNANRKGITYKTSTLYWHSDQSFTTQPTPVTMLKAVELPTTGGNTLFADTRVAYDNLSPSMKSVAQSLSLIHSFSYLMAPLIEKRQGIQKASEMQRRFPDVIHPLVQTHPYTQRKALFLNELCVTAVDGLPQELSDSLLKEFYAEALKEERVYSHRWQCGDVVVWYNPGLLHRAADIPEDQPRVLYRSNTQ